MNDALGLLESSRDKNKIKGGKHLHVGWLTNEGFRLNAQILRAGMPNAGSLTPNRLTSRTLPSGVRYILITSEPRVSSGQLGCYSQQPIQPEVA